MKRTILATLITATSFGSIAAVGDLAPVSGVGAVKQHVKTSTVDNNDGTYTLKTGTVIDTNGNDITFTNTDGVSGTIRKNEDGSYAVTSTGGNAVVEFNEGGDLVINDQVIAKGSEIQSEIRNQAYKMYDSSVHGDWDSLSDDDKAAVKGYIGSNDINDGSKKRATNVIVDYVYNGSNFINGDKIDDVIKFRKNNENKVDLSETLTAEQKVAVVNKLAKSDNHFGIKDGQLMVTDSNGITRSVSQDEIALAKSAIQKEAAKRAPETVLPPSEVAPTPQPIGAPDWIAEKKSEIKEKIGDNVPVKLDPIKDGNPDHGIVDGSKGEAVVEALTEYAKNLGESGQNMTDAGKAAAQQAAVQQNQIDELYALGNQNASDIDTLFSEVDRLDTRIDQTQALNAATVNARPMVQNGMTAFGAGVGYAGSEAALAVGVAHSFVDTGWSASGTLAASSDDVVVGGGVQYAF